MNHRTLILASFAAFLIAPYAGAQTPPAAPAAPAPAAPAAPKMVPHEGVVKIGGALKQTRGRVTDVDKGDNGCYITFRDDKKNEIIEVGKFELCAQKPPFKGKQVEMEYNVETIQAGDCYGDPKCKKTETIPVVVSVKIVD
jgi:nucleoid-associated protein YgaU